MHIIQTRLAATHTQMSHRRSVHTTRPRLPMPPDPAIHDVPPIFRRTKIASHTNGLRAIVLLHSPSLSASVAQLAEHALRKRMVMGSIPIRGWCTRCNCCVCMLYMHVYKIIIRLDNLHAHSSDVPCGNTQADAASVKRAHHTPQAAYAARPRHA